MARLLTILLGVAVVLTMSAPILAYSGGSGNPEDPYKISTVADWQQLMTASADWNKSFVLTANLDLAGITLTPIAPDTDDVQVGYQGTPFTGTFNGSNHIIRNAVFNLSSKNYVGLFGQLGIGGNIQNVGIENSQITGRSIVGGLVGSNSGSVTSCYATGTVSGTSSMVGSLVGYNYYGAVSSCYATGTVSGTSNNVGGLVGNNSSGSVTSCYATGSVSGTYSVGGLVGSNSSGSVTSCYATGSVSGASSGGGLVGSNSGSVTNSIWDIQTSGQTTSSGGIGKTTAEMEDINTFLAAGWDFVVTDGTPALWYMPESGYPRLTCQMSIPVQDVVGLHLIEVRALLIEVWPGLNITLSVEASDTVAEGHVIRQTPLAGSWVQGGSIVHLVVAGKGLYNGSGTVEDPYRIDTSSDWLRLITTPSDWDKHFILTADLDFGGALITPVAPDTVPTTTWFQGTSFTGVFDGKDHILRNFVINQPGYDYVGLFGQLGSGGKVQNVGIENFQITGRSIVGGLMGLNYSGSILSCYATGSVSGTSYVGGLVGYSSGSVTSCYATGSVSGTSSVGGLVGYNPSGSVTSCYATGSVNGTSSVGGLVGSNSGSVTSCYATGSVSGTSNNVGGLVGDNSYGSIISCYATGSVSGTSVGGLVGYSYRGSITNSFWDVQTSGRATSSGGIGKTTAEMKDINTFLAAGWDFTSLDGDPSDWTLPENGYPTLDWNSTIVPDIKGKIKTEAESLIRSAGLSVGSITSLASNSVPPGEVISQSPSAGTAVKKRATVDFVVSLGIIVPDIRGKTQADAESAIQAVGLVVGMVTTATNSTVPIGKVINQSPWVGTSVSRGAAVNFVVSLGVVVPDTKGKTQTEAESAIRAAGLVVGMVTTASSDTVPIGNVINQSPLAGTSVDGGSSVDLAISMGSFGGQGSEEDPYQLRTVTDWGMLIMSPSVWNKYFVLTADIDLAGVALTPVGNDSTYTYFTGIFNGNGHCLRNVVINQSNSDYIGLFRRITGGQVINLGLVDANIQGRSYVGGLCGYSDGTISGCYVGGSVTGSGAGYYVGGMCGDNRGTINQCYASGTVTGIRRNGGLVGINGGTINQCYASTTVTGSGENGGLVGDNNGTIIQCYARGAVIGAGGGLCGDYPGTSYGTVSSSFWDIQTSLQTTSYGGEGKTTAEMQDMYSYSINGWSGTTWTLQEGSYPHLAWEQAGGEFITDPVVTLAGSGSEEDPWLIATVTDLMQMSSGIFFWDKHYQLVADLNLSGIGLKRIGYDTGNTFTGSFDGNGHTISNLTLMMPDIRYVGLFGYIGSGGQVKNLGLNANATGSYSVSGLCGVNYGTINQCYATGAVMGIRGGVGGLCGENYGTILVSYATAVVAGTVGSATVESGSVGGLCGENYGTISQCYATGAVTGSYFVGGLVGRNSGNDGYIGIITSSYAAGAVKGIRYDIGGLVGHNDFGTITTCYATGSVNGYQSVGGLVGTHAGYNNSSSISCCYATGLVSGRVDVGGLLGRSDNITASFWNIETCGQSVGVGLSNYLSYESIMGVIGKTTSEMKKRATFESAGWDFTYTDGDVPDWYIPDNGYPRHVWELVRAVPNVVNMTVKDANLSSLTAGLNVMVNYVASASTAAGLVINQYPPAKTKMPGGSTVNLVVSIGQVTLNGSGTADKPYQISSAWDLIAMGQNTSLYGKYFILTTDIDLGGQIFSRAMIAPDMNSAGYNYEGTEFTGVFEGNGHIIRNVVINQPISDYVGLFGRIGPGGQIKNLGMIDAIIQGRQYVGGLVGYNVSGTITSCYTMGTTGIFSSSRIGSLCGYNGGTISLSNATGPVTGRVVGGLCGENYGTISQSYATGTVAGGSSVGGLCGSNDGTISQGYATGPVTGNDWNVGGLCGGNSGTISQSYATSAVVGWSNVGGLVGVNSGTISQSYATSKVTKISISYNSYVGGLCGSCGNNITGCFWDTETSGQAGGKTTAEMKEIQTYLTAGWDFTDTWSICEGTNYPRLQWQIPLSDQICPDGTALEDLLNITTYWISSSPTEIGTADLNHDGRVDLSDFAILSREWLKDTAP